MIKSASAAMAAFVLFAGCDNVEAETSRPRTAPEVKSSVPTPVPAPTPDPELLGFVADQEFQDWLGVYMQGSKVGWMSIAARLEYWGNQLVWREETTTYIRMAVDTDIEESESTETTRYALHGSGEILAVNTIETANGRKTERNATREGPDLVVTSRTQDSETEQRVRVQHVDLRHELEVEQWLDEVSRENRHNATKTTWSLDLEAEEVEVEAEIRYRGSDKRTVGGVPAEIHKIRLSLMGLLIEGEFLTGNRMIYAKAAGILEIRDEPEAVAKTLDADAPSLFGLTGIRLRGQLPEEDPSSVTIDAFGLGDFVFPESSRQTIESIADGARITVTKHSVESPSAALSQEHATNYLAGSVRYPVGDDELVDVVNALIPDTDRSAAERANAIFDFVHERLDKVYGRNAEDAAAVLANRAGDCSEHALLFVALSRAAGVPARQVSGLVPDGNTPCSFVFHAWAEYHDGERWTEVDPTWGSNRLGALHLRLALENNYSWAALIGNLELELVEAR